MNADNTFAMLLALKKCHIRALISTSLLVDVLMLYLLNLGILISEICLPIYACQFIG